MKVYCRFCFYLFSWTFVIISVRGMKGSHCILDEVFPWECVKQPFFIRFKPLWAKVKRTCFGPADGGVVPAFSRALDGDVVIELQALSRLGGRGELQLLWNKSKQHTRITHGVKPQSTCWSLFCVNLAQQMKWHKSDTTHVQTHSGEMYSECENWELSQAEIT